MTTLLLVHHGETDWNRDGRWQGGSDTRLNDLGREQARALADELDGNIDVVYSSDLARARETADIVAAKLQLEVRVDPRLRERSFGENEGRRSSEVTDELGSSTAWRTADERHPGGDGLPGPVGEDLYSGSPAPHGRQPDACRRTAASLRTLPASSSGQTRHTQSDRADA